jgi:hypothetical protein
MFTGWHRCSSLSWLAFFSVPFRRRKPVPVTPDSFRHQGKAGPSQTVQPPQRSASPHAKCADRDVPPPFRQPGCRTQILWPARAAGGIPLLWDACAVQLQLWLRSSHGLKKRLLTPAVKNKCIARNSDRGSIPSSPGNDRTPFFWRHFSGNACAVIYKKNHGHPHSYRCIPRH